MIHRQRAGNNGCADRALPKVFFQFMSRPVYLRVRRAGLTANGPETHDSNEKCSEMSTERRVQACKTVCSVFDNRGEWDGCAVFSVGSF